ncbi:HNH endonuclease family protein [Dietzia psychralcaliphila]|uniref:HNH endonuclease family protein n=1 Tax=Dietzia psychralcaliphila TaxID=139021 RepID=UPI001C1E5EF2|nr:HNH endonuclease family protein [Dietzia psychralcaliphila]
MNNHSPPGLRPEESGRVIPPVGPRALGLALAVVAAICAVLWWAEPRTSAPGSPGRDRIEPLLAQVDVVPERVPVPGYERDCSGDSACVFGPAWTDTTGAPGSGNGCSTRHDVLARDLLGATADPVSRCTVIGGLLVDPYTGRVVDVGGTGLRGIHVDHVFPLSAAWDLGAWNWSAERRAAFANDVDRNLLAVTGSVNSRKSDWTPENWFPPDPGRHCFYAARYLTAAVAYGLPVTAGDHNVLEVAVRRCPPGG